MSDSEASPKSLVAEAADTSAGESFPSPARKEELLPVGEKISELNESQSELLGRLKGLKEDLQNWRNNLDTQVKKYKTEISHIKSVLNSEIDQLRSDFQELRTTLKKQQEDVSISLKNLGLEDATEKDDNKGSGEENTSEDASATLGNLKLEDATENDDNKGSGEENTSEDASATIRNLKSIINRKEHMYNITVVPGKKETTEDGSVSKNTKTEIADDE